MKNGTSIPAAPAPATSAGDDESGKSRTTISLPPDIMKKGLAQKSKRRAASFSNYVEILIAEDIARSGAGVAA